VRSTFPKPSKIRVEAPCRLLALTSFGQPEDDLSVWMRAIRS
jgi:hypothetical protein